MLRISGTPTILALVTLSMAAHAAAASPAEWIAAEVGDRPGLALDIGCGDASLAIEVARRTKLMIQCVDPDAEVIAAAREAIDRAELYGVRVAADVGRIDRLNYPDRCASLVIFGDGLTDGLRGRDLTEVYRVLNPNGVAIIGRSAAAAARAKTPLTQGELARRFKTAEITSFKIVERDGVWAKVTRPFEAGWDEWTHRAHDPACTHASADRIGGPDLKLLWAAAPQPALASATVLVSAGRLIEIGRGYRGHEEFTPYIQVSDAFTGIRLWAKIGQEALGMDRPLLNYSPIEPCSDAVAAGELLYVLGGKTCHVLDAATGNDWAAWPIPPQARAAPEDIWLYLSRTGERMFGATGPSPRHTTRGFHSWGGPHWRGVSNAVFAMDPATGKARWAKTGRFETASIVVGGGKVFVIDIGKTIHALDPATGTEAWSKKTHIPALDPGPPGKTRAGKPRLPTGGKITHAAIYADKLWVMYAGNGNISSRGRDAGWKVAVFSAADGSLISEPRTTYGGVSNMTFSGDTAYMAPQHGQGKFIAVDTGTGKVAPARAPGPRHSKCTPLIATPRWLFYRHQAGGGFTRIDRATKRSWKYDRIRCNCHYPGLPAYGLLFVPGPGCNCAHPMRANVALIPGRRKARDLKDPPDRLVKGPAFGAKPAEDDGKPALPLALAWTKKLPGDLAPVAAAEGLVFVASTDRVVRAFDAATGEQRWRYFAAGAVRVTPFYSAGRLYVSDDDGWAHCLRASDGKLVWKFRAALGAERVVGYGRFMSAWPAGSGVLVHEGVAYLTAGFFPQEGGRVYALDADTGEVLWTRGKAARRRTLDCFGGAMAMGESILFIPTVGGPPIGLHVKDANRKLFNRLAWRGAFCPTGQWVMTLGDEAVVGSADRQFTHHVATYNDLRRRLPVVTDEAVYLRDGRHLSAEKRSAYKVHLKSGWLTAVKSSRPKRVTASTDPADALWKGDRGVETDAVILAGGTLLSASAGRVIATDAAGGRTLWSAPVAGKVADLAFAAGRLIAVTDGGAVTCFAGR
ncbi:MAG: outer membrane protein assembly factor BamB family protein [Planctomycetota bacterium]|jgi:outer membrane protein assembly factor BamB/SAM-dependent methyltransferase